MGSTDESGCKEGHEVAGGILVLANVQEILCRHFEYFEIVLKSSFRLLIANSFTGITTPHPQFMKFGFCVWKTTKNLLYLKSSFLG
jgi:hypothetical protein